MLTLYQKQKIVIAYLEALDSPMGTDQGKINLFYDLFVKFSQEIDEEIANLTPFGIP